MQKRQGQPSKQYSSPSISTSNHVSLKASVTKSTSPAGLWSTPASRVIIYCVSSRYFERQSTQTVVRDLKRPLSQMLRRRTENIPTLLAANQCQSCKQFNRWARYQDFIFSQIRAETSLLGKYIVLQFHCAKYTCSRNPFNTEGLFSC